jgi:protein-disulfide isomerase
MADRAGTLERSRGWTRINAGFICVHLRHPRPIGFFMKLASVFILAVAAFAQTKPAPAPAPAKPAIDKVKLEAYLRHVELWIPEVSVSIGDPKPSAELPGFLDVSVQLSYKGGSKDERYFVSKDGKKILKGDVYDIDHNPFQSNLDKLKTDLQPCFGAAGAPVVLVMFSDFQCPLCKEEAQTIRKQVATAFPDKVRVYFKDYPLDSIHNWARTASIAGRCVFRQNPAMFWDYFDYMYDIQAGITPENLSSKIQDFASQKSLNAMQLSRCIETKAPEPEINKSVTEGRSLGVDATPTMYLNGRKLVGNIPWQSLEQLIKIELDHQAKTGDAGEKCCTVAIPKLVPDK